MWNSSHPPGIINMTVTSNGRLDWLTAFIQCYSLLLSLIDSFWTVLFTALESDCQLLYSANCYSLLLSLTAFIQCYSLLLSLIDSFYTVLTAIHCSWIRQLLYSAIHYSWVWSTAFIQCYSLLLSLSDSFYTVLFTALESEWQLLYSVIHCS